MWFYDYNSTVTIHGGNLTKHLVVCEVRVWKIWAYKKSGQNRQKRWKFEWGTWLRTQPSLLKTNKRKRERDRERIKRKKKREREKKREVYYCFTEYSSFLQTQGLQHP